MKIELKEMTIRDVVDGYEDNGEEGVAGYNGLLNIRPKYQREFVYDDKKKQAVIDTIMNGFPLNVMYWVKLDDGTFEVLDGQQRTISFCDYAKSNFSVDYRYFHNLEDDEKEKFLDYPLSIYVCEGTDSEKLDWFRTINIAGEKLTDQELRNAVYAGEWLTDLKRYFSRNNCPGYNIGKDYMTGKPIRQDYVETVLRWISNDNIEEYMAQHQHDDNAGIEWKYFQDVINWVKSTFPNKRSEMKKVAWGDLYNKYKDVVLNPNDLETRVKELMMDDDVGNKSGIYPYVLGESEKVLSIRLFSLAMKREAYERQNGCCNKCRDTFEFENMEGDHIISWAQGGKTISENCQMLCKDCNRRKSNS